MRNVSSGGVRISFMALLLMLLSFPGLPGEFLRGQGKSQESSTKIRVYSVQQKGYIMTDKVIKKEEEWKKQLTPLSMR
jgi:hypothetical protein